MIIVHTDYYEIENFLFQEVVDDHFTVEFFLF